MDTSAFTQAIGPYDMSSCIVYQDGKIAYHYEKNTNASHGLMPINSCTKSVLSALMCIAMDKRLLPEPNTLIASYFPSLRHDPDERKRRITLQQLLTLTAGFAWTEFGGANSFPKMTRSEDWVSYVLEQPMSHEPGAIMVYNSGVSQLLAALLMEAAEMPVARFAELQLFEPLGIEQYNWKIDPQGIHTGGYGLELAAMDMLKFGLLYLQKGSWNGEQLISETMVERSTAPAIAVNPPERGLYSWHWWVDSVQLTDAAQDQLSYYYARGFGGQFIIIVPSAQAVVVLTRVQRKKGLSPLDFFREYIAPRLVSW